MTTNQEGRQAALRDSTSTAYGVAADWHALFDDAGISAGTFNERLLSWINAELSASYSNLVSAMQAYAADAGYDGWEDMATLVLAMNGAETLLDGETQGLAFDFTDQSALIIDTGTPANDYDSTGIVSSGALVGPGGKLTYTGPVNGGKLCRQSDGYYKYGAHNLCLQSEDFATTWTLTNTTATTNATTAPDGTTTADLLQHSSTTTPSIRQDITTVAGGTYVVRLRIKQSVAGFFRFIVTDSGLINLYGGWWNSSTGSWATTGAGGSGYSIVGSPVSTAVGDGWYDISMTITVATTSTRLFFYLTDSDNTSTRSTTPAMYLWGVHVYRYPAVTDYIRTTSAAVYALPYSYAADGSCEGILVEEQRTGLFSYSADPYNSGSVVNATASSNAATSIFGGTTTASLITFTGGGSASYVISANSPSSFTSTSTYTLSVIVEYTNTQYIQITGGTAAFGTTLFENFDIVNGTVGTAGVGASGAAGMRSLGNNRWLLWIVGPATANSAGPVAIAAVNNLSATRLSAYTASGTTLVWHLKQAELGSFPTSPILTYGAAATRAADQKSQLTSTLPFSATAGSLYAYIVPYAGSDLAGIVSLNDGSGDEEIVIYKDASANIVAQVEDGGANQLAPLDSTVNASSNTAFKVALAWAANDFALSADSTAAQTDTGGTLPTVTTLEIGADQANNYFNGIIKAISYVPRRKSDAELQAETT